MGSGVGLLARKIRLAMTMVMESWIKHYSLDLMVFTSNFYLDEVFFVWETFFILKCACLGAFGYLNLHWKLLFPAICSMQNSKIICLSDSIIVTLLVLLKWVNSCQIIFQDKLKLVRILYMENDSCKHLLQTRGKFWWWGFLLKIKLTN